MFKNKKGQIVWPISYFTASVAVASGLAGSAGATGASTTLAVESAVGTAAVSTCAAVESVASFVADPEPHAVSVNATPRAKINVYFFILYKI
jgi:hypothetical protein